jgi:hypothetical protein
MAIVYGPESAYAKEMTKFEARDSVLGPGLRPYVYREYPMMLHRAGVLPKGGIDIIEQETANSDRERQRLEQRGFRATPLEAVAVLEGTQLSHSELSAEREWEKRHRLSAKAVAEVEAHEEAAGSVHLPMIPETPIAPKHAIVTTDRLIMEQMEAQQAELEAQRAEIARLEAQVAAASQPAEKKLPGRKPKKAATAPA